MTETAPTASIRIGTQGWNYPAWLGGFFPDRTRSADFLSVYARAFDTVEVDSTFYAVPAATTLQSWYARTPDDFIFSLKFPSSVTHEERLRDATGTTELFFERVRELRDKLGPILVQLGPDFGPEEFPALASFLPRLPSDLQIAVEFRQRGWVREDVLTLLSDHGVALALVDGPWMPRRWALKLAERPTANFAYIRWMGPDRSITDHSHIQIDRSKELAAWSDRIRELAAWSSAPREHTGQDHRVHVVRVDRIYGYTSNYYAGHAPRTARELQFLLGLSSVDPEMLGDQIRLL